ncbi:MarR family transcriptional regulator [Subtercola boreus]|uniref:MarR family transcriptional regulator n=1 Tax=Subtercola boreus TaxID=120213 RepID=UPI00209BD665|nr:MarR family transcriptional regulator [Subtercola boreus]
MTASRAPRPLVNAAASDYADPAAASAESLLGDRQAQMSQASLSFRELLTLTADFERVLAAHLSINATDLEAMEHLIEAGPLSPTELAHRLGITTAATTLVIDRLEKAGHAAREAHPSDRRKVRVVPAEASVARTFTALRPLIFGVDAVLDDFAPSERTAIELYLARVADVYRAVIAETPPPPPPAS